MATLDSLERQLAALAPQQSKHGNRYDPFNMTVSSFTQTSPTSWNITDNINKTLGYWAKAVIVDNLTNQWLFIPDAARFISPNTTGKVVPLYGTQVASIQFQVPPGVVQQQPIIGQLVTAIYTDLALGPSDGSHLAAPAQNLLGTKQIVIGGVAAQATVNFPCPTGTRSVYIVTDNLAANLGVIKIIGHVTGTIYTNSEPKATISANVVSAADNTLDILFTQIAANSTVNVTAYAAEDVQQVITHGYDQNPPAWQMPNQRPVGFNVTLGGVAGNTATIIGGGPGQIINVFTLHLIQDTTVASLAVTIRDTVTNGIMAHLNCSADRVWNFFWQAAPVSMGGGIMAVNENGAGGTQFRGSITVSYS